jgi:PPOX class probable F420-dependent enzyme
MADVRALESLLASHRQGILATINPDGQPQLSNILYLWDAEQRIARITTTASRVKARNLERDPRCSLHVSGEHFWSYAVAEGEAELSAVAESPGDEATGELLPLHTALVGTPEDEGRFYKMLIDERRLVVRFRFSRLHGVILEHPPG